MMIIIKKIIMIFIKMKKIEEIKIIMKMNLKEIIIMITTQII